MPPIQSAEMDLLRQWSANATKGASFHFLKTGDERARGFQDFVSTLTEAAPEVRVTTEVGEEQAPPAFIVGKALRYSGVPVGNELAPFLDILSWRDPADTGLDEAVRERIAGIVLPAELKLYVTPQCHFCPKTVRLVAAFALVNPLLRVNIIDGLLFPELSENDGVRSVPTLILDNGLRWTGTIRTEEILEGLIHRDPSQLSAQSMESILKEGNAQRLAEMMLEHGRVFPAFPDLLKHPEWSVRLGAMVVMEELAAENRGLASSALEPLWEAIGQVEDPVKGDLFYIFGLVGSAEWIPRLEGLLALEMRPELREVVEEALEALRSRN